MDVKNYSMVTSGCRGDTTRFSVVESHFQPTERVNDVRDTTDFSRVEFHFSLNSYGFGLS